MCRGGNRVEFIAANTEVLYKECLKIRFEVFVSEQEVPENEEIDKYESDCEHFLVAMDSQYVGTARYRRKDSSDNVVKIERVAVVKPYRGEGVGRALMQHLHEVAKASGYTHAELGAQIQALPFYSSLGYEKISDMFLDAGIEHFMMRKKL